MISWKIFNSFEEFDCIVKNIPDVKQQCDGTERSQVNELWSQFELAIYQHCSKLYADNIISDHEPEITMQLTQIAIMLHIEEKLLFRNEYKEKRYSRALLVLSERVNGYINSIYRQWTAVAKFSYTDVAAHPAYVTFAFIRALWYCFHLRITNNLQSNKSKSDHYFSTQCNLLHNFGMYGDILLSHTRPQKTKIVMTNVVQRKIIIL